MYLCPCVLCAFFADKSSISVFIEAQERRQKEREKKREKQARGRVRKRKRERQAKRQGGRKGDCMLLRERVDAAAAAAADRPLYAV